MSLGAAKNKRELAEIMCVSAREAFDEGEFDDAFEKYQRALKIDPDLIAARISVGRLWLEFGEYDRAYEERRRR